MNLATRTFFLPETLHQLLSTNWIKLILSCLQKWVQINICSSSERLLIPWAITTYDAVIILLDTIQKDRYKFREWGSKKNDMNLYFESSRISFLQKQLMGKMFPGLLEWKFSNFNSHNGMIYKGCQGKNWSKFFQHTRNGGSIAENGIPRLTNNK